MEVLVEVEGVVGEGFRGWDHLEGGSRRRIPMEPEGNLAVMVDRVVTTILSLDLEEWVKVAQVEEGTRAVDVMAVGMEVPGGMTIVIVTAITMEEVTTVEGGEGIIEAVGGDRGGGDRSTLGRWSHQRPNGGGGGRRRY
jgi:hypothetical protein